MFAKQLLAFGAFLGLVAAALACDCIPLSQIHPVDKCPGHFLSVLTIDSVDHPPFTFKYFYRVVADLTPRTAQNQSMTEYKKVGIFTADHSAACGVQLELGFTYLIFGTFQPGAVSDFPRLASCGSVVYKFDKFPTPEQANKELEKVYQDRCVAKH